MGERTALAAAWSQRFTGLGLFSDDQGLALVELEVEGEAGTGDVQRSALAVGKGPSE